MTSTIAFLGVLSSPSSSNPPFLTSQSNHDVFLSFRREDIRNNFTIHLYHELIQKGINTYKDDKELRKGEKISPALSKAIEESKISIVIFSKNYASSTWCLDELLKILECKESKQQKVLAVYYKVEPSTVRHQNESFEAAFAKHKEKFDDAKVQKWKTALNQTAELSGFHLKIDEDEYEFIQKIVQEVSTTLPNLFDLHVAEFPVGMKSRVEDINMLLCTEEKDIRMIGIFGVGGIGKTAIAKEMYNRIINQFEGGCFLANVRESSKQDEGGLVKLQQTILSDILKDSSLKVSNVDQGINLIMKRLCHKRILLVLDDVDCLDQLEKLCGRCDWFGSGSRIIITTRDEGLLTKHHVHFKYRMKEMDHHESLKLFCKHAFKSGKLDDAFADVIELALNYAAGLPLALQVIGSNLYGGDIHFWKSELKEYKRIPEQNIYEKLKISYDGLDHRTKKIFLDIACFFKGCKREYVTKILNGCGFNAYVGIKKLNDKCLITIDEYDRLMMHDLLEDMGKEIVRQESPKEPGQRSRLWFHEDVREVLEKNKGTEQIEGILIEMPWKESRIHLDSEDVFEKMKRLRILIVKSYNGVHLCGGLNYLSNELRVLDWFKCPLKFLPSSFHGEKLIDFSIEESNIRDLGTRLQSKNLTSIDLSCCEYLTNISDLSSCSNLEKLCFYGCTSLVEVHDSVGFLDKLVELDFSDCSSLKNLPRSFKLRSLELLKLDGCTSLENFPEIECEMEYLERVELDCTEIQELPSSITYLTGLNTLYINDCDNLVHFPVNIFQLEHLQNVSITCCPNFVNFGKEVGHNGQFVPCTQENKISSSMELSPPESNNLSRTYNFSSSLRTLNLSGSGIVSLPPCIERFVGLFELNLTDCKQLEEILHLPPNIEKVDAYGCSSLKNFLPESNNLSRTYNFSSSLRTLNLSGSGIVSLPPCIEGFVGLFVLDLKGCKQLEEILHLPPNIEEVCADRCSSLKNFLPESNHLSRIYNFSSSLRTLNLSSSVIVSLPPCIEGFVGLSKLYLTYCKQLKEILHLPPNIKEVDAEGCSSLKNFLPELNNLTRTYNFSSSLRTLNLSGSGIVSLPPCIEGFVALSKLVLKCCEQLEEILHLPRNIEVVDAAGCSSLKNFLPESNNLSRTYNFSSSLGILNLSGSGIVSLPPCIEGFVGLSELNLRFCKQLEEILHLPPNIKEVDATGCVLLERFPHVSTKSSFGTPDLKRLRRINLSKCNKVEVNVGNHAPDPLLVQERFREKDSSTIIYSGSRIPEWFKYCKETTSYSYSIEIEIDHNASMYCGHQIVALVLCFVVGPLPAQDFYRFTVSINGWRIGNEGMWSGDSMDPHDRVWLQYIVVNSIDHEILPRSYREGNNNMRFAFRGQGKAILKSGGVHLIYGKDNFIDPIQPLKRYRDDGEHDLEPDWKPQQKR